MEWATVSFQVNCSRRNKPTSSKLLPDTQFDNSWSQIHPSNLVLFPTHKLLCGKLTWIVTDGLNHMVHKIELWSLWPFGRNKRKLFKLSWSLKLWPSRSGVPFATQLSACLQLFNSSKSQCCWILAFLKGFYNTDLKQRYQCTMMVRIVAFFKGFPILISSRDVLISWLLQHAYWDTNCLNGDWSKASILLAAFCG